MKYKSIISKTFKTGIQLIDCPVVLIPDPGFHVKSVAISDSISFLTSDNIANNYYFSH